MIVEVLQTTAYSERLAVGKWLEPHPMSSESTGHISLPISGL